VGWKESGSTFACSGRSDPVVLVCKWPGQRPIDVPFDAIELTNETPCFSPQWTAEERKLMSEIAGRCERDASGRFTKYADESMPSKGG